MSALIDWDLLVELINKEYGTSFKNTESMLRKMYREIGGTKGVCEVLGVSHTTIRYKMKDYGIKLKPKGGANFKGVYKGMILSMSKKKIKSMTLRELSEIIGCKRKTAWHVCRCNNIEFKREKPIPYSRQEI